MRGFISSLLIVCLWLSPAVMIAKAGQINTPAPQGPRVEQAQAASCERVQITFNDGHKIKAYAYQYQGRQIKFIHKDRPQIVPDKDVKRIEISQGSCPTIELTLHTGEKIKGYRRDYSCDGSNNCIFEINAKGKLLAIADSDIRKVEIKTTFAQKLKHAALIPLYPFAILVFIVVCGTGRCKDGP